MLTAVREGSGQLVLREIDDRDLGVLFEHSRDRDAIRMAAFTSPEADDRTNFERRWARLRSDGSTTNRVVEIDGRVVGHIASFDLEGHREVTYWIGREDWGRGMATRALQEFLQLEATRPLYAHAASDNAASIRVLTKCGFLIVGEGREFAQGATRKRTRSCSDSMHEPNCPRLPECSRMFLGAGLLSAGLRRRSLLRDADRQPTEPLDIERELARAPQDIRHLPALLRVLPSPSRRNSVRPEGRTSDR